MANDCLDLQKSLVDARSPEQWERCMKAVLVQCPETVPLARACQALGLNRSTVYARQKLAANEDRPRHSRKHSVQPRALSAQERTTVIEMLHSAPYCDQSPTEVYQRLLEQEQYLCSVSTIHRLLRGLRKNGERRHQRPAQHHTMSGRGILQNYR